MEDVISQSTFEKYRRLLFERTGIYLPDNKRSFIAARLYKRLRHYGLESYDQYFEIATTIGHTQELTMLVDLLTTNETSFFREPRHLEYLKNKIVPAHSARPFRVWSAACSTGQEPYSIGMALAEIMPSERWEVLATDVNYTVLESAQNAIYSIDELKNVPDYYKQRYCLEGVRSQAGKFKIDEMVRSRIDFSQLNLNGQWPELGKFHVVFLRNVMIYFGVEIRERLLNRIHTVLHPRGYLVISHSESLTGINVPFRAIEPSIYQK